MATSNSVKNTSRNSPRGLPSSAPKNVSRRAPTSLDKNSQEQVFEWEGKDRTGKPVRGEMRAMGVSQVQATLRRQGVFGTKITKRRAKAGKKIKPGDIATFTRQMATMMKAGVPLLQSFDIVGKGHPNPSVSRLLNDIRMDVEGGSSLSSAFRKHPKYFDVLYCNLVEAGEAAGILEELMHRLASYMEKSEKLKRRVRSALMYPALVLVAASLISAGILMFVVPAFKDMFASFGADLPGPTLLMMAMSDWLVEWWWVLLIVIVGGAFFLSNALKRSEKMQESRDRFLLRMPIFGALVDKSCVARWARTMSTMFGAGIPLVEALDTVGGAAGNVVYAQATEKIQREVATGTSLTVAMTNAQVFPPMLLQMASIGEETGALDSMLSKVADFYEDEVEVMVAGLSSLMEPLIIIMLGVVIGGMVVAMYLPIFKMSTIV